MKRIVVCPNCGTVSEINETEVGEDWLACLPLPAEIAAVPAGKIHMVTGVILYVDGKGNKLSRQDYMDKYGTDPEPIWESIQAYRARSKPFKLGGK
ncbi:MULTISPECIES: hypothetical protein [Methanothrix]|uniref:hypothetical protein n=1 Tax=Methanothrix TaxID=2222 RepID=UPI001585B9B7|nr:MULTISPECIES: hypothetical protein [Methanothrix]NPU87976.1 hypothetical protein [Methanothrix sp.]